MSLCAVPSTLGVSSGWTGAAITGTDYRVRAVNGGGTGEWSGPAQTTTERSSLTARFEQAPAEHEGPDSTFTVRLLFSEAVSASYGTLRDQAITATNGEVRKAQRVNGNGAEWNVTVAPDSREAVTVSIDGGTVRKAQRRQSGSDLSWTITVEPDSHVAVSIHLPETTSCGTGGAIWTSDGRPLSDSLSASVRGPAAMSVADARVEEATGAAVAFAVALSRAATGAGDRGLRDARRQRTRRRRLHGGVGDADVRCGRDEQDDRCHGAR